MKSICIYCGSADAIHSDYKSAAWETGKLLAQRNIRVIYGGGKTGLMGEVANGALAAGGEVIGITIPAMNTPALAPVNLTTLEVVPHMHARKARMHELSDGYIALPGGYGTWDELFETIAWGQTGAHTKPVGILNVRNFYTPLLAAIDHATSEGFIFEEHRQSLCCESDPSTLLERMLEYEHPHEAVKRWMREE